MGSRIAAPRMGSTPSAMIGMASAPTPANPPFARPEMTTAMIAQTR